jgi:hypothetical protein
MVEAARDDEGEFALEDIYGPEDPVPMSRVSLKYNLTTADVAAMIARFKEVFYARHGHEHYEDGPRPLEEAEGPL